MSGLHFWGAVLLIICQWFTIQTELESTGKNITSQRSSGSNLHGVPLKVHWCCVVQCRMGKNCSSEDRDFIMPKKMK